MKYAVITITLYYTDDEGKQTIKINLKNGDEKEQIEKFIIGYKTVMEYCNLDFEYLLVESIFIEYYKKEILDITKLDI